MQAIGPFEASNKAIQLLQRQTGSTKPKSEGHSGGSKSIRGTTKLQSHKEVDEKEEHQPTSKTSPVER